MRSRPGLRIGVTMRESQAPGYDEPRDALARNWAAFLHAAIPEAAWLPVPNLGAARVLEFFEQWELSALMLTGGEDLGMSPIRDESEHALLAHCLHGELPVLGVCRGMQLMWQALGGQLEAIAGHRAVRHIVTCVGEGELDRHGAAREVNSFHSYCVRLPSGPLPEAAIAFASAEDGTTEGIRFRQGRVVGVMWHPEREPRPDWRDVALLRGLVGLDRLASSKED